MTGRLATLVVGLAVTLTGCSVSPRPAVTVSATTTQLGSVVGDIAACAGGTSRTLMTPGLDPHDFSLSSADVAGMERSRLVVTNGLGLEGGMTTAIASVVADGGRVYEVGPALDPRPMADGTAPTASDGHDHDSFDPHVWMDVARMATAAGAIGVRLAEVTGDQAYARCGRSVEASLRATDADVRRILSVVPPERRILVTDHEAFGYFAQAYGFTIAGVVVPGGSTDADPSSADLRAVVDALRATRVRAIFSNTAVSPKLVQAVSADAGGAVAVVPLYVDSVGGAGSGAESYADMMLFNARAIASALG